MSRPPSARPKTSSGRAASAARRTSAAPNGDVMVGVPRPESRAAVSRMGRPEAGRPPTSFARPPSHAGRPPSNAGRPPTSAVGARPQTGLARPQSAAIRPVTQQGLSGGRAVSRMGTASTRQVFDKSYFMGMLRAKMGQLNAEIIRLEEVYAKGERDRMELVAYEKRAQESALEIKDLQGRLVDLNIIIDRMHTNSDMVQIEMEAKRVKATGDEFESGVQELFTERQQKEREAEQTALAIDEQKKLNHSIMAGMEPGLRDRYEELKQEAEDLKNEAAQLQAELTALDDKKLQLEMELQNSPLKKKAVQMHESLAELAKKEEALLKEKSLQQTPEQKKQHLMDQMKQNNEDITNMEKQIEPTNEQIEQCVEELRDFENDDSKFVKNNERYRELAMKEQQIEEFLRTYPEEKRLLTMEMEEYTAAIVQNLQKISVNIGKVSIESNVTDLDPGFAGSELHEKASPKELKDLHVRLQEEMITLEEMETKLNSEIETLQRRLSEMEEESEQYGNVDRLSVEAENNMQELEASRNQLEVAVPESESQQEQLHQQLEQLQSQLDSDPNYAAQKSLVKKLEMMRETNASLKASIMSREAETDYESIKKEVTSLRLQYNNHLLANTGRK